MNYTPGPAQPQNLDELWKYLQGELRRISETFATLGAIARTYNEPPRRPPVGLLAIADGANWDPGQAKGIYIFDGTGWVLIKAL